MRHFHSKLTSRVVTSTLITHLLTCLHLRDYQRSVSARLLARLLLFAAATGRSLSALANTCDRAPSDESVRLALHYNLPPTALVLLDELRDLLHQFTPPAFRKGRPVPAALDLHLRPYYGAKDTQGTCGGQKKAGTKRFWAYGTLVLLHRGLRLTVGLCPTDGHGSVVSVVRTLVEQAHQKGIHLKYLLLDRGFYDAQVVAYLQQQQVPFVMPMIRRGLAATGTGTQPFFRKSASGWHDYSWTARPRSWDEAAGKKKKGPAVTVQVRVYVHHRGARRPWVFACWGLAWDGQRLVRRYRTRFGIETSYRQLGQSLALTTSKNARVRLLLVGLALLLRQYWAWAHYALLARVKRNGHRQLRPHLLRLVDVLLWLLLTLAEHLGYREEIAIPSPYQTT